MMKKYDLVLTGLLITVISLSSIILVRTKASERVILKNIDTFRSELAAVTRKMSSQEAALSSLVKGNGEMTKELIEKFNMQLGEEISMLAKSSEGKNRQLSSSINTIQSLNEAEAEKLRKLLILYIDEAKNNNARNNLALTDKYFDNINKKIDQNKIDTDLKIEEMTKLLLRNEKNNKDLFSTFRMQLKAAVSELSKNGKADTGMSGNELNAIDRTAENDAVNQQLNTEGKVDFNKKNFTEARNLFQKVLNTDPKNTEALLYYHAALYYQNPGDESSFFAIKKSLGSILEGNECTKDQKRIILPVLLGISIEEGNKIMEDKYRTAIKLLKEEN